MNMLLTNYVVYLAVTIPLTVWVGRTLSHHGHTFLVDVMHGDEKLARAINQLLVIGFYLLNLGFVAVFMKTTAQLDTATEVMENVVMKTGIVAVVLGAVHLGNIWAFNAFRRRAARDAAHAQAVAEAAQRRWQPPVAR